MNQLMETIPAYIEIIFICITILTVAIFYAATKKSKTTLTILISWIALQTVIGISGFYTVTDTFPPRFLLLIFPPLLIIAVLFATAKGRQYIDGLNIKTLTLLHTVRIPVEIVLYSLFVNKAIPELMTFDGRNYDIISGITAPLIYYFGFVKKRFNTKTMIIWNTICLILLINIVTNAVLSAPFPFQKFAFEQPNIAVLYFPFNCLPACIVPLVFFSHLVTLRQLVNGGQNKKTL